MLRTGVVITDGNNLHAEPGGKKVVDQLAKDDRLWVLEEVQHRKKWLMVQPWRQGGRGYVIADAVQIDNATDPAGAGMPDPPKPTEMPDLPPQMSAVGVPDGVRRFGSTGHLFEAKNGQWMRWLAGAPEFTKFLKPPPEPLDAWEIAIAAAFVILALLLVWT
jgi:hypothetical protein